eukprot:608706-Pyramimonas_sp.AAC.1
MGSHGAQKRRQPASKLDRSMLRKGGVAGGPLRAGTDRPGIPIGLPRHALRTKRCSKMLLGHSADV